MAPIRTKYPLVHKNIWMVDILFLSLSLGWLFFALLGIRPLFVPDEGRYAEIIREMVSNGNYITPYLNGIKYFEKPNLFYWLGSIAVHLNGLNVWSIRGVNALFALFGCWLTYFITRQCYDRKTAMVAAFILGTSTLYFVMSQMISLDLTVTFFISACLYAFLLSYNEESTFKRRTYLLLAASSSAFAVLTKGLIGIVFPFMIILPWLTIIKGWLKLDYLGIFLALLLFLLLVLPWHILVQWHNPEFFNFYFIEQHFLRYTNPAIGHYQPNWYFIPILIIGFFPWIVFLPQTLLANCLNIRRLQAKEIFFWIWAVSIFAFFSFSKSKLIPYILPVFPPLAIVTARYLVNSVSAKGIKIGYFVLVLCSLIIGALFYWYPTHHVLPDAHQALFYLLCASVFLIIGASVALYFALCNRLNTAITLTPLCMILFLLTILSSIPAIDARSIRPLAYALKPLLLPNDEVITYDQYFQDLPFYLEKRVSILNWRNELSFGMQHQDTSQWMIDRNIFWQRFKSNKNVYVIMTQKEFKRFTADYPNESPQIIAQTVANVLISNKKKLQNT